jgi:hypothetical protein
MDHGGIIICRQILPDIQMYGCMVDSGRLILHACMVVLSKARWFAWMVKW